MAIPCIGLSSHSLLSILNLNLLYYPNLWMTRNRLVSTKTGVILSVFLMFIHQTYGISPFAAPELARVFLTIFPQRLSRWAWHRAFPVPWGSTPQHFGSEAVGCENHLRSYTEMLHFRAGWSLYVQYLTYLTYMEICLKTADGKNATFAFASLNSTKPSLKVKI